MKRWEAGALAHFAGDEQATRAGVPLDYGFGASMARDWAEAGEHSRAYIRLAALWLEHRAQQLELEAVELLNEGKGVEAERAQDDGRALEVAAAYVRRELLGEEGTDAKP